MAAAILCLLIAQATGDVEALTHPSRTVREEAIARLAEQGPATGELVSLLAHEDARVVAGIAAVLQRRLDPAGLPALARHADHPDAARAEVAARTVVAIASRRRIRFEELHYEGMDLLPRRLERAAAELASAWLGRWHGGGSVDRPQLYRPLYAGGSYTATALGRILRDTKRPWTVRAHALHAYARLVGRAAVPALLERLDDPRPQVRAAAAALVWRYGDRDALATLARQLDAERALHPTVRSYAAAAAEKLRMLGARGAARLVPLVRDSPPQIAAGAAAALRATYPELAARTVRARVLHEMEGDARKPGAGLEAALFELRLGPLTDDLRARLSASSHGLIRAVVEDDPARALELAGPWIAPRAATGAKEHLRLDVTYRLLLRHPAPWQQRVAFAAAALRRDTSYARRQGLRILRGAPPELWQPLLPRVYPALLHSDESTRLAAAALLVPRPRALEVCVDALYDGDPRSAAVASDLLREARPDLPAVDPRAPVAERRRLAIELGGRIGLSLRDKE
ncbi:MAG: HEAT repeat domain-containing protein [Planctomycetota bacterium]|jgi:HEAT repeat protein